MSAEDRQTKRAARTEEPHEKGISEL